MSVHGPAHHHVVSDRFVEEDMLFERPKHIEESPVTKTRISKAAERSKLRVLSQQPTGGFDCGKVSFCHVPACLDRIPSKLPLNVHDEIVRLADAQGAADAVRARTRSRMPA